jgi:hypothetical protein
MDMRKHTLFSLFAVLVAVLLMLSACTTPGANSGGKTKPDKTTSTDSGNGTTGDFSLFGDSSASATSADVSAAPTTEAATPAPTPTPAPTAAASYAFNFYTATDGTYVYYCPGDGIHRMGMDGSGDQVIVGDCFKLLGINENGLFYIVNDPEYVPVGEETGWQYCLAFKLMLCNPDTGETQTLLKHVYMSVGAGGYIYIIDHVDHSLFQAFDISAWNVSEVTGLPADTAMTYLYIWDNHGKARLGYWIDDKYYESSITGSVVDGPVEVPVDTNYTADIDFETGSGMKLRINYDVRKAYIWNGSAYSDLGLQGAFTVLEDGGNAYVLTESAGNTDANGKVALTVALYRVGKDGSTQKVFEGPAYTYNDEGSETYEMISGWLFSFWVNGDGGTSSELLLGQRIN